MNEIWTLFSQVPLVGAFAWFVWVNNKEWREFLKERNSKTERSLQQVSERLERIHVAQEKHTEKLIRMEEKNER